MKNLKTNVLFKSGVIILLILILLIPTTMVRSLINEREWVQKDAIEEVSSKWARGQEISGPYLSIPYDKYVKRKVMQQDEEKEEIVKLQDWIYLMPEVLEINGEIFPKKRYRGIYEVVVYESELNISGTFNPFDTRQFDIPLEHIHFDQATFNVGISDLKGIEKQIQLKWDKQLFDFDAGLSSKDIAGIGINAGLPVDLSENQNAHQFSLNLSLKGSQHVYFTPVGKTTNIRLTSNWTTPSFTGNYLPDHREVNNKGFDAHWNILHLNRNYPQAWVGSKHTIGKSSFGLDLLLPVDNYKRSDRVAKYAILFIVLTFMVFFFVEVLNKVFIHPIQYLLVGIALVVFYTLLLSFSEHMLFNWAYLLATVLTLGLVSGYTFAILKSKQLTALISGILVILYAFIFTIIQLEDYALLIGSIGVFLILALVMYFSRKIDWYQIRLGKDE